MLKLNEIELEFISDTGIYSFIEKKNYNFFSTKKISKADNKHMQFYYDKKPSKDITYLDGNNLYGWAINQSLPYSEFNCLFKKNW